MRGSFRKGKVRERGGQSRLLNLEIDDLGPGFYCFLAEYARITGSLVIANNRSRMCQVNKSLQT